MVEEVQSLLEIGAISPVPVHRVKECYLSITVPKSEPAFIRSEGQTYRVPDPLPKRESSRLGADLEFEYVPSTYAST